MPRTRGKYSNAMNEQIKMKLLDIVVSSPEAQSIQQMQAADPMFLGGITSQKIARVLGEFAEKGLLKKSKSKATGRMMYKAVCQMKDQGYEIDDKEEDEYD